MSRMTERDFNNACSDLLSSRFKQTLDEAVQRMQEDLFNAWLASGLLNTEEREALHREATAASALVSKIENAAAIAAHDKVQNK